MPGEHLERQPAPLAPFPDPVGYRNTVGSFCHGFLSQIVILEADCYLTYFSLYAN